MLGVRTYTKEYNILMNAAQELKLIFPRLGSWLRLRKISLKLQKDWKRLK